MRIFDLCPDVLSPELYSPGEFVGLQLMRAGQPYLLFRVALPTLSSIGAGVAALLLKPLGCGGTEAGFGKCAAWGRSHCRVDWVEWGWEMGTKTVNLSYSFVSESSK